MNFKSFLESNLPDLYKSAAKAFPGTRKRQFAVDEIKITKLSMLPFLGMNTLFVKGLAQNIFEGTEYEPMILMKKVKYHKDKVPGSIEFKDSVGGNYIMEPITDQDVLVRCQCKDFLYRFHHYNFTDHSLYGRDRKPYHGLGLWKANPMELPGMCKHLMKLGRALSDAKILS